MNNIKKIQVDDDVISIVGTTFKKVQPKTVKTKPCRIKFRGQFITTESNKTVWRNRGFAKSALLNHFSNSTVLAAFLSKVTGERWISSDLIKSLIRDLESQNIVEYVEVDMEEFAVSKAKS